MDGIQAQDKKLNGVANAIMKKQVTVGQQILSEESTLSTVTKNDQAVVTQLAVLKKTTAQDSQQLAMLMHPSPMRV